MGRSLFIYLGFLKGSVPIEFSSSVCLRVTIFSKKRFATCWLGISDSILILVLDSEEIQVFENFYLIFRILFQGCC